MPHGSTGVIAEQKRALVIPSHAAWYTRSAIHRIETRALPEFFTGKN